jgi:hypothetical protein
VKTSDNCVNRPLHWRLSEGIPTTAQKEKTMSSIVIPLLPFTLGNGDVIALRAANGLYLSMINRGDKDPIEAAKTGIDGFSLFTITVFDDSHLAFCAANGKFLSMINRGDKDPIEAAKTSIDPFSQFIINRLQG